MELCTNLQKKVLDLEKTKTTQQNEIDKSSGYEESLGKDASKQGRINAIDADEEITLAQALEALKPLKPKVKGVVIQEPGESTTTKSSQLSSQQSHDKGKGIMIEHVKPIKKKHQISFDEETVKKIQAEFDEEERLAREKAEKEKEANIALIEEWDDFKQRLMLIINWLKDCKHKNKKSCLMQKRLHYFNNS
ncbi:hypothetical protein Tco_1023713 [Tanacetum coccineum]